MRFCGYPAWRLVGMESVGFWLTGRQLGLYKRTSPEADEPPALFSGLGLNPGDPIGQAVGHESDARLDLPQQNLGTAAPDVVPPTGLVTLAESYALADGDLIWDYAVTQIPIVTRTPLTERPHDSLKSFTGTTTAAERCFTPARSGLARACSCNTTRFGEACWRTSSPSLGYNPAFRFSGLDDQSAKLLRYRRSAATIAAVFKDSSWRFFSSLIDRSITQWPLLTLTETAAVSIRFAAFRVEPPHGPLWRQSAGPA
jgi:hypothetical protein